jgi:thiamine pyrophosphate-dependent acetolactate synthase large subunit-like protein
MARDEQAGVDELSVPQAIAEGLGELGVRQFFGLMGDDTALIASYAAARGMTYCDARHENAAVAMATGYSRATGQLSVCVLSRGPGLTNALTAAVNANRGDASVLVIVGDTWAEQPMNSLALPDYKYIDLGGLAAACELPLFVPTSPQDVTLVLRDAAARARGQNTVLFALPREVMAASTTRQQLTEPQSKMAAACAARPEAVAVATAVLSNARRPLIVAGRGAWDAGAKQEIEALADRTGAILATSLRGKDMFRGYPYAVDLIGSFSHTLGRRLMDKADCVLAVGASLNRFSTVAGTALPSAPLIQIDKRRGNVGRNYWADVSLVGDCKLVVQQLLDSLPPGGQLDDSFHSESTAAAIAAWDPVGDYISGATSRTVDPRDIALELDRLLPAQRQVVTDVGNFFGFIPAHITVPDPSRFMLSSDFSAIGLGLGTALGAALARSDEPTVLFIGDGALLMSLGEIETVARHQPRLIIVVMNDGAYGAERHYLSLRNHSGSLATFPGTDFAEVATAWGIEAHAVQSIQDLRVLSSRLATPKGPILLDCRVNPTLVAPFLAGG